MVLNLIKFLPEKDWKKCGSEFRTFSGDNLYKMGDPGFLCYRVSVALQAAPENTQASQHEDHLAPR